MNLSKLTQEELSNLFLKISDAFLKAATGKPTDYVDNAEFLKVRKQLHDLMDELARRREIAVSTVYN